MCYLIFIVYFFVSWYLTLITWPREESFGMTSLVDNNFIGLSLCLFLALVAVYLMDMWLNAKSNRLHRSGKIPEIVARLMCYTDNDLATRRLFLFIYAASSNLSGIIGSIAFLVLLILYIVYEVKCSGDRDYRMQLVKQYNEEHPDAPLTRVPRRIRCFEYFCWFALLALAVFLIMKVIGTIMY